MPLAARLAALAATVLAFSPIDEAQAQMSAAAAALRDGPDRVVDFQLDWGPVKLADISLRIADDAEGLVLDLQGASRGLAAIVVDFEVQQRVAYASDGARRFETLGSFDGDMSRRAVRWTPDGAPPSVQVDASTSEGERTPIPPEEMVDTVDPVFPMVDALGRVEAGGVCTGTYRVFDGERRMNVILEDEGDEILQADRDWTYSGPARRCRLRFQRIGGFLLESDSPVQARENEYDRTIWVARLEDGMAPVRLRVAWPLGYATGRIVMR